MNKTLADCIRCKNHIKVEDNFVSCKKEEDTCVLPVMPSNWVTGFKNGTLMVNCLLLKEPRGKVIKYKDHSGSKTMVL